MSNPQPLYTRDNCRFSCPLRWGLTVFWRQAEPDDGWFQELAAATEPDGIRPLKHDLREPAVSQFAISTQPHVSPLLVVQRVKGRLQYLVRHRRPKAFQGNYAIRSVGHVTRQCIEAYVADQLGHHGMADPRIQARFEPYQIDRPDVDLSQPQKKSHGIHWYNLHVVLVHQERWMEVREEVLQRVHDMIVRVCEGKGYRLSRAGMVVPLVEEILKPMGLWFLARRGFSPLQGFVLGVQRHAFSPHRDRLRAITHGPKHFSKMGGNVAVAASLAERSPTPIGPVAGRQSKATPCENCVSSGASC